MKPQGPKQFLAAERKARLAKHFRISGAFRYEVARRFMDLAPVRIELELQAEFPHIYRALREKEA